MKFLFLTLFFALIYLQFTVFVVCLNQNNQVDMIKSTLKEEVNNSINTISNLNNKNELKNETKKAEEKIKINNQPEFLKKKEIVNILSAVQKTPTVKISEIDTKISFKKNKNEGEVLEKVKFILQDGVFSSVMRKISLGGTADRHYGLKLASA